MGSAHLVDALRAHYRSRWLEDELTELPILCAGNCCARIFQGDPYKVLCSLMALAIDRQRLRSTRIILKTRLPPTRCIVPRRDPKYNLVCYESRCTPHAHYVWEFQVRLCSLAVRIPRAGVSFLGGRTRKHYFPVEYTITHQGLKISGANPAGILSFS